MSISSTFRKKQYFFQLESVKFKRPNYLVKFLQQMLDSISTESFLKSHASDIAYRYVSTFREQILLYSAAFYAPGEVGTNANML